MAENVQAPAPTMPPIDQLRLDMIAFLYAAAVGYGFAVLDAAPGLLFAG